MTNGEKVQIVQMRKRGLGYAEIARSLGLSVNTVKSYDGYDIELCFPKRYIKSTNGELSWGTKLNWPEC